MEARELNMYSVAYRKTASEGNRNGEKEGKMDVSHWSKKRGESTSHLI